MLAGSASIRSQSLVPGAALAAAIAGRTAPQGPK